MVEVCSKEGFPEKILVGTRNRGKVREIADLVRDLPVQLLSLDDLPDAPDVIEDGSTFAENALKKARVLARSFGVATLADDSGLCVDALADRPGVLSARYGGDHASDHDKCLKLLAEMAGVPDSERGARFVCVLALVLTDGKELLFEGICKGRITTEPSGTGGFGYDPIFLYEPAGITFARMDRQAKNLVSHRGSAVRQFVEFLRRELGAGMAKTQAVAKRGS